MRRATIQSTKFGWLRSLYLLTRFVRIFALTLPVSLMADVASLFFVANEGQWAGEFAYRYDGGGGSWFVTPEGLTIDLKRYSVSDSPHFVADKWGDDRGDVSVTGHVLKVKLVGGNRAAEIVGEEKLPSYSNYFFGRDSTKWRSRVGHFQKVVAREVWPGIDVEYLVKAEGVETVFRVKAGADVGKIQVEYEGLDAPLSVDSRGNLLLKTSLGTVKEKAPYAFQAGGRRQQAVPVQFRLVGDWSYTIAMDDYDPAKELVIDPLLYGTYLCGASIDYAQDVALYPGGGFVVCGHVSGHHFPTTPGAYMEDVNGSAGYVTRFSAGGDSLIFSTFIGAPPPVGNLSANLKALCVDNSGTIYCIGRTYTPQWPVTENAIQGSHQGEADAVFLQLNASGTGLLYSTFLGSPGYDFGRDLAIDGTDIIYLCGDTGFGGVSFPITPDALFPDPGLDNAFLLMFNPADQTLIYSTYLPGNSGTTFLRLKILSPGVVWTAGYSWATNLPVTPNALQPERAGETGEDGIVALWDLNLNQLLYCSYFGGSAQDRIHGIDVLNDSLLVVAGTSNSTDFPTTEGAFQPDFSHPLSDGNAFVTVMNPYEAVRYSTFFAGGPWGWTETWNVAADSFGTTFFGVDFAGMVPTTPGAFDTVWNDGVLEGTDVFLARLSPDLSTLYYCTYLGGAGYEQDGDGMFDDSGTVWICGATSSPDQPVTEGAFQTTGYGTWDGFILNFEIPPTPPIPPNRLTIQVVDSDVILNWSATGYDSYRVFSLPWLNFPYPYLEGVTGQTTLALPNAAQNGQRVYYVVGVE